MMKELAAGTSFGVLCEGLCEWVEEQDVATHAAVFLKRLIWDQLIAGVESKHRHC
jgi:hypothetical protein